MDANKIQHGGDHYRTDYQHWDWCIDIQLPYLESAATKYLSRWRKKNGVEDLKKASHYLAKAAEAHDQGRHHNTSDTNPEHRMPRVMTEGILATERFLESYDLHGIEAEAMWAICTWHDTLTIWHAVGLLEIIADAVEQGRDPRTVAAYPRPYVPSTAGATGQGSAPAPKAATAALPEGSTIGLLNTSQLVVGRRYKLMAVYDGGEPVRNGGEWIICQNGPRGVRGRKPSYPPDHRGIALSPSALWMEIQDLPKTTAVVRDKTDEWDFKQGQEAPFGYPGEG